MKNSQAISIETPSLPTGGGAVYGMGESMGAVGPDGLASLSLPLPISAGRGAAPALALNYSSGAGNSSFGMGWHCSVPMFSLRTAKGTPQYTGTDEFLGPDGEVLVPVVNTQGGQETRTTNVLRGTDLKQSYTVTRWQSRIALDASRIELWQPLNKPSEKPFWVLFASDGQVHLFGKHGQSQVADPHNNNHIACWLLEETVTPTGEHFYYNWQAEDDANVDKVEQAQYSAAAAQRYLTKVSYGNIHPSSAFFALEAGIPADEAWLFHLVFDYGERSSSLSHVPSFFPEERWACRKDCFSRFDYGFEVRTRRLCRQVLMFHRLKTLAGESVTSEVPALVSRLILQYDEDPCTALLLSARSVGHESDGTPVTQPPLEFDYTRFEPEANLAWQPMPQLNKFNALQPYQLVDLYGEGLPGILYQDEPGAWWYRAPERDTESKTADTVTYDHAKPLPNIPIQQDKATLMDVNGDGQLDWVVTANGINGYHSLAEGRWTSFIPLATLPLEYFHAQAQLTNMTGAGLPDLSLIGPRSVRLWSNNRQGWQKAQDVPHEGLPLPVPGYDATRLVAFSDMGGSGQSHLVEITADSVCYWPNLGHGCFGNPINMGGFSLNGEVFNPQRLYMADMDGSGTTDLIYVRNNELLLWINESGNHFAPPVHIPLPKNARFDDTCRLLFADVRGQGTGSIVLTTPHKHVQHWRLDLAPQKPWLLNTTNNNMGAEITLQYRSSAQFWLDEKARCLSAGRTAISHLPFPVHLLWRSVTRDEITGNQLISRCDYAHGVWDGREREYRGFARIIQTDVDELATASRGADTQDPAPSKTISWYATGLPTVDNILPQEFWRGDKQAFADFQPRFTRFDGKQDSVIKPDETQRYWLDRALKGTPLRSELYGDDGSVQAGIPYTVSEYRTQVRLLSGVSGTEPAVMPSVVETRNYQYERIAEDPQCQQRIVLMSDDNGLVGDSLEVAYPRRPQPTVSPYPDVLPASLFASSYDEQQQLLRMSRSRQTYHTLNSDDIWLPGLTDVARSDVNMQAEKTVPTEGLSLEWCLGAGSDLLPQSAKNDYAGHQRIIYTGENGKPVFPPQVAYTQSAEFDEQSLSAYADVMDVASLQQALNSCGWLQDIVPLEPVDRVTVYVGQQGFTEYAGSEGFYRPVKQRTTSLTGVTTLSWDHHYCVPTITVDAAGLTRQATYDYRFLHPTQVIDENDNVSLITLDALGRPTSLRFYGTENGKLTGYTRPGNENMPFILPSTIDEGLALKSGIPVSSIVIYALQNWMPSITQIQPQELQEAKVLTEDNRISRLAWRRYVGQAETLTATPPCVMVIETDRYDSDKEQRLRQSVIFSDGFSRELQSAVRHESGDAWIRVEDGALARNKDGSPEVAVSDFRWAITGRTEYDNKGQVVRTYQPYFLNNWRYLSDDSARQDLYADTHTYDPLGRVYQVMTAKGALRRTLHTPWFVVSEDENDTASTDSRVA